MSRSKPSTTTLQAIARAYEQGKKYKDIASEMGITPLEVTHLITHARKRGFISTRRKLRGSMKTPTTQRLALQILQAETARLSPMGIAAVATLSTYIR